MLEYVITVLELNPGPSKSLSSNFYFKKRFMILQS